MDDNDINRHKRYLYSKGNMLIRNFKHCSEDVKARLLKTFCNNTYGGHLWSTYRVTSISQSKAEVNVFRKLYSIACLLYLYKMELAHFTLF